VIMKRIFRDTESNELITEQELKNEFLYYCKHLSNDPRTFEQYIKDCTSKNGFLEEVKNTTK